jgi:hypothetical protein
MDASTLIRDLTMGHASPQRLVVDGTIAPLPKWHSGPALIEPFGDDLVQLSAWPHNGWWIGCGVAGSRVVLFVAERAGLPADALPDETSLVESIVALTDWNADRPYEVDWTFAEGRLGTALPADFKELVEAFGCGQFGYDRFTSWFRATAE